MVVTASAAAIAISRALKGYLVSHHSIHQLKRDVKLQQQPPTLVSVTSPTHQPSHLFGHYLIWTRKLHFHNRYELMRTEI